MPRSAFEPCSPADRSERRDTCWPDAITLAAAMYASEGRIRAGGRAVSANAEGDRLLHGSADLVMLNQSRRARAGIRPCGGFVLIRTRVVQTRAVWQALADWLLIAGLCRGLRPCAHC